jgi:ATP-dependent DNA ligase
MGKSLTSGFPEIVTAFRALSPKRFVLDGELALPKEDGFSFDGLVNRLRIGSARLALEVRDSPAIYIAFDMLANSENLLGSPFRLRRKTLERVFENSVPRSSPLYLSASTEDLREVEKWVGTSDSNSTVLSPSAPMRRTDQGMITRPLKSKIIGVRIVS